MNITEESIKKLSDDYYEAGNSGDGLPRLTDEDVEHLTKFIATHQSQLKQQILDEVIGEDQLVAPGVDPSFAQNLLRKEQRQKLEKIMGGK